MKQVFKKTQLINHSYEVQFFIWGDNLYQKYRVKGKNNKTYLLKLYNSSKLSRNSFSNENLLEVEILAMLDDPNIIKLVDNGELVIENQKYHFIVFDFIPGETLSDKLKRESAFSSYSAVPIIIELLESLSRFHNHPKTIIHNNINTSNISLDYSDNREKPIITDFGFARYITSKSFSVDLSKLSPFYIAPELYNGVFTPQSDIFSVGALLYNLIIGLPPWYIEIPRYQHTEEKFINAINEKRTEPLNFGIKDFDEFEDEHLKETIKKALSLNIEDRFENAYEFIKALKREVVLDGCNEKKHTPQNVIKKKGAGFSAIAGMDELKEILHNDIIRALNEKERFDKYEIPLPNGMLLYGPPGCGKTFISEKFAEEVGFNFIKIITSDIASIYIHGTQEKIGQLFKEAEKNAPTVIFIDEIDAMVPKRGGDLQHSHASEVNEFLAQINNCGERGIFVIAATNRPEDIDPAMLRAGRIDYKIYLPPPDFEARKGLFEIYLKNKPTDLEIDYNHLAEVTSNYVSVDIKTIIDFASRKAEKKDVRISQDILLETIMQRQPSISNTDLKGYELIRNQLENITQKDTTRRPIGFRRNNND
ncbi:MAG: AAA family ATPase [Bacteroidetes bacterium]|nr:AAA family ATPase [Bacteroidota bacterium]